jgi:polyisoprenyl-phosphate glycosyltransferase
MEISKEQNFVSAVVYIYKDEELIKDFVLELHQRLKENFLNFEIILVNDATPDKSLDVVRSCARGLAFKKVTILNMSFHHGLELSMNAGVDLSIGDFVFEFDSVTVDYDWKVLMEVYKTSLKGYDIVSASSATKTKVSSSIFYRLFNRYAHFQYALDSESFRILSRRAINRVYAATKTIPYRKATYANSGLKITRLTYKPVSSVHHNMEDHRADLAINSLILFTDVAYRLTVGMSFFMIIAIVSFAVYALVYYFMGHPVEGWTTTILFVSFSFFGVFVILAMILKYLSILINLTFRKQNYMFELVEKL